MKKQIVLHLLFSTLSLFAMDEKLNVLLQTRSERSKLEVSEIEQQTQRFVYKVCNFDKMNELDVLIKNNEIQVKLIPLLQRMLIDHQDITDAPNLFYDAEVKNVLQLWHEAGEISLQERSKIRQNFLYADEMHKEILKKQLMMLRVIKFSADLFDRYNDYGLILTQSSETESDEYVHCKLLHFIELTVLHNELRRTVSEK